MPDNIKKLTIKFPPVLKVLVRGYIIMGFVLALEILNIFANVGVIIFLMFVLSITMMFGVGYLLAFHSGPVRKNSYNIPNTVLFFVKGSMILYFVTLIGQFGLLPIPVTSLLILMIAGLMVLIGTLSYVLEVIQRATPVPKRKRAIRPRAR